MPCSSFDTMMRFPTDTNSVLALSGCSLLCRSDLQRQTAEVGVLAPPLSCCVDWAHYLTSLTQFYCQCLGGYPSLKAEVRYYFDHESLRGLPWKSSSGTVHELLRRQTTWGGVYVW